MATRVRTAVLVLLVLGLGSALAGCARSGGSEAAADVVPASEAVTAIEDGATVIDVRTPEEFDEGHLDGARNIDVSAEDFESRIEDLERSEAYLVYCRTGSRAAAAVRTMLDAGFEEVVNGGGYDDLAAELRSRPRPGPRASISSSM